MQQRTNSRSCSRRRRRGGFTLIEIMIVILVIGILLNIAAPQFIGARDKSQARSCVKNLSDFQTAKEQYAMDSKIPASSAAAVTWTNISPYIRSTPSTDATKGPACPSNATIYYVFGPVGADPSCPYYRSSATPLAYHQL